MKRLIYILILVSIAGLSLFSGTAVAATVTIHDDGPNGPNDPYGPGFSKTKDECVQILEAENGMITGAHGFFYYGGVPVHLWLLGNGASVTVESNIKSNVIYVQHSGSDMNDGPAEYYVDGELVATIDTWMRGNWYVEIRDIGNKEHTVMVVAPTAGDINLDYFGFGDVHENNGIHRGNDKPDNHVDQGNHNSEDKDKIVH